MIEFHINNIDEEWMDLAQEFPKIFLELSPEILEYFPPEKLDKELYPNGLKDLCNLRYGFECHIKWKDIIREFAQEMEQIRLDAEAIGEEAYYCSFILKNKWGRCTDQGSMFGKDRAKYRQRWIDASRKLYDKSK
jgi:hypothetical protein